VSSPGRRPRVLALTELVPQLRARLESVCELTVRPAGELTDAEVAARVPGFDGLLSLLTHRVGKATFAAGRLVIVANCAVGVDNIDLAAARAAGVVVTHTPGVLTEDTADLTWALILAVTRRVAEGDRFVRSGRFAGWRVDLLLGRSLASLTLGVVGAGRIGRAVLARAAAFSMRRLYASRTALPPQVERELGAERRPLSELLAQADVVSLHVPLTDETRHLLNARALARMKPGAYLINTSRGSVVDEAALAVALDGGRPGPPAGRPSGGSGPRRLRARAPGPPGASGAAQRGAAAPRGLGHPRDPLADDRAVCRGSANRPGESAPAGAGAHRGTAEGEAVSPMAKTLFPRMRILKVEGRAVPGRPERAARLTCGPATSRETLAPGPRTHP
jgi:glyoxylate reductase